MKISTIQLTNTEQYIIDFCVALASGENTDKFDGIDVGLEDLCIIITKLAKKQERCHKDKI